MSGYLINTVTIENNSAPLTIKAGTLLTDSSIIAAVQAMGGMIGSAADPNIVAAAAVVAKMQGKFRAGDELVWDRIMLAAYCNTVQGQALVHVNIDIPLATIKANTSGAAFNIGAALPAGARLMRSELNVIQVLGGGASTAVVAKVQNTGETAGNLLGGAAGSDVHTATGTFTDIKTGTSPTVARGGQQLQATLTATGDTLANLTTGHLSVDLYYSVTTA